MARKPKFHRINTSRTVLLAIFLACAAALVWAGDMFSARAGRNGFERASAERENEAADPSSTGEKEDVDAGPFGRSSNFKDYFTRREQMVEMLRGLPNPLAISSRAGAIHQLEQQQATLLGNLQNSAVA
ncbi:MAG TPA: hypothetical protein VIW64_13550, partial [Pyrinomonadaceae bacterium]